MTFSAFAQKYDVDTDAMAVNIRRRLIADGCSPTRADQQIRVFRRERADTWTYIVESIRIWRGETIEQSGVVH